MIRHIVHGAAADTPADTVIAVAAAVFFTFEIVIGNTDCRQQVIFAFAAQRLVAIQIQTIGIDFGFEFAIGQIFGAFAAQLTKNLSTETVYAGTDVDHSGVVRFFGLIQTAFEVIRSEGVVGTDVDI